MTETNKYVLETRDLGIYYGEFKAVTGVHLGIERNKITAIIGPSGCGKSTLLRAFNRMNELSPGTRIDGEVLFEGQDLYASDIDPVEVRYRIGMVFQKPNPFPKSIYENIAWGARIHGYRGDMDELIEFSLRQAALWDEVKDKLQQSGLSLSGGQQQRLCIARAIAVKPEVILMDEPASALDVEGTRAIEELMFELRGRYTILIVTHNMAQARRASDECLFMLLGEVVEHSRTGDLFLTPRDPRTAEYIEGRYA